MMEKPDLPWVEKHRPSELCNIISHTDILNTLKNLCDKNNFPHVMFYGPPGTGKTTSISACGKYMYGASSNKMILELNGSDDRGINVIREQIKEFCESNMYNNEIFNVNKRKHKLVILDEADSMTYDAQFALRRVIETYTDSTRFCLICNYSTKIIPSLQSRCIIFRFSPIPFNEHLKHIKKISNIENINIDDNVINDIIKLSDGDMRKSLNILQSLNMTYGQQHIDLNLLYKNIGHPSPDEKIKIIKTILECDIVNAYNYVKELESNKSISLNDILNDLINYIIINKTFTPIKMAKIISGLSEIEFFLTGNINTSIQLGAIISVLKI